MKKYLLSKIIDILPIEESFFFRVKFEKNINLTKELIALNYKKHAPYREPFLTTLNEDKNLYIWFYEREIDSKFIIPEAYLMFDFLKNKYPNSLLLIEGSVDYILIIKDNLLLNSYEVGASKNIVAMELNQHALTEHRVVKREEYLKLKEEALLALDLKSLYKWNTLSIDNRNVLPKMVDTLAYPLAFLLFFNMIIELYHISSVEKILTKVEMRYSEVKIKNDDIRLKINEERDKKQKWVTFVNREFPYEDPISVFVKISKAFEEKKFTFKNFSIVGSRIKIEMRTKEPFISGVSILNSVEGLENIALKYTNRKRDSVSYEALISRRGTSL